MFVSLYFLTISNYWSDFLLDFLLRESRSKGKFLELELRLEFWEALLELLLTLRVEPLLTGNGRTCLMLC